jgi:phosphoglycolate phosphatase
MGAVRLIVFDCDGTIVDSAATIVGSMAAAFTENGLVPPDPSDVRRIIGLSLPEAVSQLMTELPAREVGRVVASYKEAFAAAHACPDDRDPLFPGVLAAFDALDEAGYLLGVATGKSRRGLERVLAEHGLHRRFATLRTADDAPGKPHPAMLEQAMAEAGAGPRETALIGDTTFDIEMARNARATAIGVSWGYHEPDELRRAGAMRVIDSFDGLAALLAALVPASGG